MRMPWRELNRAAWCTCCPAKRLGPHTLLPARAVGPAFLLRRSYTPRATHSGTDTACDVEAYKRYLWCRAELFSHYFRRGQNTNYRAECCPNLPEPILMLPSQRRLVEQSLAS